MAGLLADREDYLVIRPVSPSSYAATANNSSFAFTSFCFFDRETPILTVFSLDRSLATIYSQRCRSQLSHPRKTLLAENFSVDAPRIKLGSNITFYVTSSEFLATWNQPKRFYPVIVRSRRIFSSAVVHYYSVALNTPSACCLEQRVRFSLTSVGRTPTVLGLHHLCTCVYYTHPCIYVNALFVCLRDYVRQCCLVVQLAVFVHDSH